MLAEKEFYFTIAKPAQAEFKDRGSRFLAYAYYIETKEEFKTLFQQVKKDQDRKSVG